MVDWDVRARRAWNEYALEPVDVKEPSVAEQREEDARTGKGKMTEWGNGKGVIFVKGPAQMWKFLAMMSSHTLILCGEKPGSALPEMREVWKERIRSDKMFWRREMEKKGDVETVEGTGYLLTTEKPAVCAERAASWIKEELIGWRKREMGPTRKWRNLGKQGSERRAEEWLLGLKEKL